MDLFDILIQLIFVTIHRAHQGSHQRDYLDYQLESFL